MPAKEILINVVPQEKRVAIVSEGHIEEFYIERPQDKTIVGNIYKGKIEAVIPSIGAAFVDIGLPKKGFLYLSEIESYLDSLEGGQVITESRPPAQASGPKSKHIPPKIKQGQEVLVQVVKESFGTKGPRLTTHIGLAGRYLVLMPNDEQIGISRRIEDDAERKRLRELFANFHPPDGIGFIVRTVASGKARQDLMRDAHFLINLWKRLEKIRQRSKAPALVYEEYDLNLRVIRDSFNDEVTRLIVDDRDEYERLRRFMRVFLGTGPSRKIELFKGSDLFAEKDIEKKINNIFESKVYLKSKAYLVIEPTEGLVVIDVNSGGFKKTLAQEEAAFKVNCEAALEAARQLKLRDLGGIIVIDFIDMEKEGHRREVLHVLKKALSDDKAKYDIIGISKFGVVEMTRERVHKTVQMLSYTPCPYCQGRGKIRSALTMSIYALRQMKRILTQKPQVQMNITLNPLVVDEILKDKTSLQGLEQRYKCRINLISNPAAHIEEIKII